MFYKKKCLYLMQTVQIPIRRRRKRRLIRVYIVCQCPFCRTLGINGLHVTNAQADLKLRRAHMPEGEFSDVAVQIIRLPSGSPSYQQMTSATKRVSSVLSNAIFMATIFLGSESRVDSPASVENLSWMRRPTGDQEVAGSTPAEVGDILSWGLIMKYFLRSFSPFR